MKKSQKEINHLKTEKDQLYKERECEIKARLAAEKLASTHKGKCFTVRHEPVYEYTFDCYINQSVSVTADGAIALG